MQIVSWNNHKISKLCLGTVQFGLDYGIANTKGEVSQKDVNSILNYVVSKDINCFDTGSMYGKSEEKIGSFIKNSNKKDINIISKIKSYFFSLEQKKAIKDIDNSLNLLNVSTLFGLLLHNIDAIKQWNNNSIKLIEDLKLRNKIKYFGVSIYTDEEFNLALENKYVDIIQIPFNLLDQRAINNYWLEKAKKQNKLIFIRSVYLQGLILMDTEKIPKHLSMAKKYLNVINEVSNKLSITKNQLALSYVNQMANDAILLFGCDNLFQAKENIESYNNLPILDNYTVRYLQENLSNIDECIYNPTKWTKI